MKRPWDNSAAFLRTLWVRDRDPFLDHVRWRLHLRLLVLAMASAAAFIFLRVLNAGRFDLLAVPVVASFCLWIVLSRSPRGNRAAVRANLAVFVAVACWDAFHSGSGNFPDGLLGLMIMPVFGVVLDGMVTGLLVLIACAVVASLCLASGFGRDLGLTVPFAALCGATLYGLSLAHTWIFGSLVQRQRASREAVELTTHSAATLATMLTEEVVRSNARLRQALVQGAGLREESERLHELLSAARAHLPAALPTGAVEPEELLDRLRQAAHRVYLGIGMGVAVLSACIALSMGQPRWGVAVLVAGTAAGLLAVERMRRRGWRWRLRLFAVLSLGAMASDVWLSPAGVPTNAVVFLPAAVFYVGLLDAPLASALFGALGLLLLSAAGDRLRPPGESSVLMRLAVVLPTLLAICYAALPLYRGLLSQLAQEEERLRQSLGAYRRAVSTLFHDLANPLAVLRTLSAMPPELRSPTDADRAERMVGRLEELAATHSSAKAASFGDLAGDLLDVFRERLAEKGLRFEVESGADLVLASAGTRLRESILGNLVSNAIKFSPQEGVLRLSARREEAYIVLSVRDQGPGMPREVLRALLRGDTPASRPGTRGETGSGFGLLLASAYAREMQGRLELVQPAEGGTTAEVWLLAA